MRRVYFLVFLALGLIFSAFVVYNSVSTEAVSYGYTTGKQEGTYYYISSAWYDLIDYNWRRLYVLNGPYSGSIEFAWFGADLYNRGIRFKLYIDGNLIADITISQHNSSSWHGISLTDQYGNTEYVCSWYFEHVDVQNELYVEFVEVGSADGNSNDNFGVALWNTVDLTPEDSYTNGIYSSAFTVVSQTPSFPLDGTLVYNTATGASATLTFTLQLSTEKLIVSWTPDKWTLSEVQGTYSSYAEGTNNVTIYDPEGTITVKWSYPNPILGITIDGQQPNYISLGSHTISVNLDSNYAGLSAYVSLDNTNWYSAPYTFNFDSDGQYTIYVKTDLPYYYTTQYTVIATDISITVSDIPDTVKYPSYDITITATTTYDNKNCEIYVNDTYLGTSPVTYTINFDSLGQTTISLEIKAVYGSAEKTINWQDTTTVYDDIIAEIVVNPDYPYPHDTVTISYTAQYETYTGSGSFSAIFTIEGQNYTAESFNYTIPEKRTITIYANITDGITTAFVSKTVTINTTISDIVYTIDYPYSYYIPEDTAQIDAYAIFGNGHIIENGTISIYLNSNELITATRTAQTIFEVPYDNATIVINASFLGQNATKTIYLPIVTGLFMDITYTEAGPFYPHDTINVFWFISYIELDILPKDLIVYVNTSTGQSFVFYDNGGITLELPELKSYTVTIEAVSRQFKGVWSYIWNIDTRLSHIVYSIQYDYSVLIPEDTVFVDAQAYFYNGKRAENSTITIYINDNPVASGTEYIAVDVPIPYTAQATIKIEATLFDSTIYETETFDVVEGIIINATVMPSIQYYIPSENVSVTFSLSYDKLYILPKDLIVNVSIDGTIYTFNANDTITFTIPEKDCVVVNITATSRQFVAYWQKLLPISWLKGQIYIDGAYDYAYIDISLEGQYHVIKEPLKAVMILTNKTIAPYSFTLPNAQQNNISIEDIVITQNLSTITFMAKVGNLEATEVTTTVTIEFYTSRGTIYTFTDTYVIPASAYKQISFTFTLPNSFYGPIMAKITITNSLGQSLAIEYITPINPAGYYVISWNTFNTANYHYENVISKNATAVMVLASDYVNVASLEPIEANIQIPEASITTVSVVTDRSFYETGLTAQITITINMTPDYPAKVLLYIDNTLVKTWNLTGNATLLYQYEITENYPLNVQYSIPVQVEVINSISGIKKAENSTNIYVYNSGPTIILISPPEYSDVSGNLTLRTTIMFLPSPGI